MSDGYVYFAHTISADPPQLKVGHSRRPELRIREIGDLRMIVYVPGPLEAEQALHEILSAYRIHHEWYRPGQRVHRIIRYCRKHGRLPECILEAGQSWHVARLAKREHRHSISKVGDFFRELENFDITRESDPFALGRPHPARSDLSWLENTQLAA